jgi:hypothetical protein
MVTGSAPSSSSDHISATSATRPAFHISLSLLVFKNLKDPPKTIRNTNLFCRAVGNCYGNGEKTSWDPRLLINYVCRLDDLALLLKCSTSSLQRALTFKGIESKRSSYLDDLCIQKPKGIMYLRAAVAAPCSDSEKLS